MLLACLILAALWGIGYFMAIPKRVLWRLSFMLYFTILVLLMILPDQNALRNALGGTLSPWIVVGILALIIWAYRIGLRRLRARADAVRATKTPTKAEPEGTFSDSELERYARHIMLREIGGLGQKRLKQARVLVIGAGGLGAPALQYLAASGVGTLGIIDPDRVENSNLQRQVLYRDAQIGMPKVFAAQEALCAQNPFVTIRPYHRAFTAEIAAELVKEYDLILEGSDDFVTKALANQVAFAQEKPIIIAALSQWEGQLALYAPHRGGPCYSCVFPKEPDADLAPSCAEAGVFSPLTGVTGALMAGLALQNIVGRDARDHDALTIVDMLFGENRKIHIAKRADCPVCAIAPENGLRQDTSDKR